MSTVAQQVHPEEVPSMAFALPPDILLSALMSSRLCHDLVGPIGAVNNGVELLAEADAEMRGEAESLIAKSAGQAIHRLGFFRLAYGGAAKSTITSEMARDAATAYFADSKIELLWDETIDAEDAELHTCILKLCLNLTMLAGDTLARGGTMRLKIAGSAAAPEIAINCEGPMATMPEAAVELLAQGGSGDLSIVSQLDARKIHPFVTGALANILGMVVNVPVNGPKAIEVNARKA